MLCCFVTFCFALCFLLFVFLGPKPVRRRALLISSGLLLLLFFFLDYPGTFGGLNVLKNSWKFAHTLESAAIRTRGLHGGPETRGPRTRPGTRTGSGLYFKWSAGSGSGPNLLLRVPGLFNIPESIGEHRNREWSVSVCMRVCDLQFVKFGWEKCEWEIRWKKKTRVTAAARSRARAELM